MQEKQTTTKAMVFRNEIFRNPQPGEIRLAADFGDPRSAFFFKQLIHIAIQRGLVCLLLGMGATSADLFVIG